MAAGNHPKPIVLFDISQGTGNPTEEERRHVRECEECQTVIAIFARQFGPKNQPKDKKAA